MPARRETNKDGFDRSHLNIDLQLRYGTLHRDYIAHCFRWTYAVKHFKTNSHLRKQDRNILDIGCGRDVPLFVAMAANQGDFNHYYGVDLGKIEYPKNREGSKLQRTILENTNILDLSTKELPDVNAVVSFEVFEHMPARYVSKVINHSIDISSNKAEFIFSTPCWDPKVGAAKNHPNEMTREAFGYLLEECGLEIVKNFGTFASLKDYKHHLTEEELSVFSKMAEYYDVTMLSTMLAPLYPQYSRNNLWVLRKADNFSTRYFPNKPETQWASGPDWKGLLCTY